MEITFLPLTFVSIAVAAIPADLSPDFNQILEEANKAQVADIAAWKKFKFRRQVQKERLSEEGKILKKEVLVFQLTPIPGGFDEKLISINGKDPTPENIKRHRRLARFTKFYNKMSTETYLTRSDKIKREGLSLRTLLRFSSYHYGGEELLEEISCYRLDFEPNGREKGSWLEKKFAQAMAGNLWITVDGHHIMHAKSRTIKPISFFLSLGEVTHLDISMESVSVAPGIWIPKRIEVESTIRILFKTIRKRTLYIYTDFVPISKN